jgi:cell wall-active antibiotic response 4TMS protein YvqF
VNRYILIHRLKGPAVLLLIGVLALLDQAHVIDHFWRLFWPLLMIMLGVLLLAERAALAADGYPVTPYGCGPWGNMNPGVNPNAAQTPAAQGTGQAADPGTAIVPARTDDFGDGPKFGSGGGQL